MQISEHQVRECAYYIWENEGRVHGRAAAHWIRAEAELHANAMAAERLSPASASKPASKVAAPKAAVSKAAAPKAAAPKAAALKAAAPKASAPKVAAPKTPTAKAAAKPAAPKPVRASKAAVTAGLSAKAKPARAPASMH